MLAGTADDTSAKCEEGYADGRAEAGEQGAFTRPVKVRRANDKTQKYESDLRDGEHCEDTSDRTPSSFENESKYP